MAGRDEFVQALEACEQTSAALLVALDSDMSDPTALVARRSEQIQRLAANLPEELRAGELDRLRILLNVGQQSCMKTIEMKVSAIRNLASLQRALQVARQLAATSTPRSSEIDCIG
jgi:hypothetical protein